ncbi:hypothetical protein T190_31430 [Sinorhizobium meliloti CCBAU 01290]|nr:hypothetical protein T190_31430 [Sinorhizobium meliloti CCBAU 01290]
MQRLFDEDLLAGGKCAACDIFLSRRRRRNIDGIDIVAGDQLIGALDRDGARIVGGKFFGLRKCPARNGGKPRLVG